MKIDSASMVRRCIETCEDHKAVDLIVYDVRGKSVLTDYCLVLCGASTPHIRALAEHIQKAFRDLGIAPRSVEGTPASRWVLIDYNDLLIHIFHPELREYYSPEKLLEEHPVIYPEKSRSPVAEPVGNGVSPTF